MPGDQKSIAKPAESQILPQQWLLLVALASALGLLLGAGMIILSLLSVSAYPSSPIVRGRDPAGMERRSLGSPSAPVVITEWSDFQCPACARFATTREPVLERLYVDSGKVRFVHRNEAFLGPESFLAAEAADCAGDQGRFWDYRTLLFQRQRGENSGAFSAQNLKGFAAELGLDRESFAACLDGGKYRAAIQAEAKEGDQLGVDSTPSFFINGKPIKGIPTIEQMQKLIEEELAKKP